MTEQILQLLDQAEALNKSANRLEAESLARQSLLLISESHETILKEMCLARANHIIATSLERRGLAEQALPYAEYSLQFARDAGDKTLQNNSLKVLGNIFWHLSNYPYALENYHKSLQLAEELDNRLSIADVTGNIGNIYWTLADYPRALEYYHKALELNEQLDSKHNIIINLGNIGNVYGELNDSERAMEYYHSALKLSQEVDNKRSITINTGNIGTTYADMHLYPQALEYMYKALDLAEEIDNKQFIANNTNSIGLVHFYLKDYGTALEYLQKSLNLSEQLGDTLGIAINDANIASIYSAPDFSGFDSEKAEELLLRAISIQKELGTKKEEYETRKTLIDLYKHTENIAGAFEQLEQYHALFLEVQSEEAKLAALRESMNRRLVDLERDKAAAELEREIQHLRNVELVTMNEQITEQNIKLEWLNQEKNEFLGIAAHDLKNPLVGIVMTSDLIIQYHDNLTKDMVVERIGSIKNAALRMKEIVSNILDINSIESGEVRLTLESIDAAVLISQIIENYSERLSAKSLEVHTIDTSARILCVADRALLHSVIDNLFSNAIKYSPTNKRIWVNIIKTDTSVQISIRDEGQGLTENDMTKLFGKFSKLSARPTAGEHSTGLGLSIVKKLVELMNGRVWAESDGKGCGAVFFVELEASR